MTTFLERRDEGPAIKPMKVQEPVFLGIIWGCLAIALICSCLRFLVRIRSFKKLFSDDYFVIAALLFVLANAITWQVYAHNMYYIMAVAAGLELPGEGFAPIAESYFKSTVAVIILFYSALWSIKISFLLFFRRLGKNVTGQKALWWPVFIFTLATYFACIGSIQYSCLTSPLQYLVANCSTEAATSFQQITLKLNCAWDVITDCLIMLIPIMMIRGVQMRWQRKVALAGIFSLVVITMIFAIVRTALVGSSNTVQPDSSWLYMWSAIEASVAVVVACLASFRNLFSREPSRTHPTYSRPPGSSNIFLRGSKPRSRFKGLIDTLASHPDSGYQAHIGSSEDTIHSKDRPTTNDSHSLAEMPKAVHVRSDIDVYHNTRV